MGRSALGPLAIAIVATFCAAAPCIAQSGDPVAAVLHVACAPARCFVRHDNVQRSLRLLMPLYVDDQVVSGDPHGYVEIATATREVIVLRGIGSSPLFKPAPAPNGFMLSLWREFASVFYTIPQNNGSASARVTVLPTMSICPGAAGSLRIVAGRRTLRAFVQGGVAPLDARLENSDGALVAAGHSDAIGSIHFESAYLAAGRYRLTVRDASNRQPFTADVDVTTARPDFPQALEIDAASEAGRTALRLGWLAQSENGAWALEATSRSSAEPHALQLFRDMCSASHS